MNNLFKGVVTVSLLAGAAIAAHCWGVKSGRKKMDDLIKNGEVKVEPKAD